MTLQKTLQMSAGAQILHLLLSPDLIGKFCERGLYDTLQGKHNWADLTMIATLL